MLRLILEMPPRPHLMDLVQGEDITLLQLECYLEDQLYKYDKAFLPVLIPREQEKPVHHFIKEMEYLP